MSETPNFRILPFICIHNIFYLLCYLFHVYIRYTSNTDYIRREVLSAMGRVENFLIYFQFVFLVEFLY